MAKGQHGVDYETFAKCKSNFDLVRGLFREGMGISQVCRYLAISEQTFYKWKSTYPEFEAATVEGREAADYAVENALYRKAVGFAYTEKKIIERNGEIVQKEIYQKQALPDSTACAIWLNNRQSEKWKKEPNPNNPTQKAIEINVINAKEVSRKTKSRKEADRKNSLDNLKRNSNDE